MFELLSLLVIGALICYMKSKMDLFSYQTFCKFLYGKRLSVTCYLLSETLQLVNRWFWCFARGTQYLF